MAKFFSMLILLSLALAASAEQKTVDQLKAEAEHAAPEHQGRLYAELADKMVSVADKQFTDGESVKGHATVQEILQYAIKAHDLAIETRRKMKETEKSLRECHRRLDNM
jgi:stress-induced morphogen